MSINTGSGRERHDMVAAEAMRDDTSSRSTAGDRHLGTRPATVRRESVGREYDTDHSREVELPAALNLGRDRVRWGPIWAGLLAALGSLLLLSLLGLAIGLTVADADPEGGAGIPSGIGVGAAIWGALTALVSFLIGGYVAGMAGAIFGRKWGALNGALVFLLAIPVTLLLGGMGLGSILGILGTFVSGLNASVPNADVQPGQVATAAQYARNSAWGTLLGLLVGLGAAAAGGALGTRRTMDADRLTADVTA